MNKQEPSEKRISEPYSGTSQYVKEENVNLDHLNHDVEDQIPLRYLTHFTLFDASDNRLVEITDIVKNNDIPINPSFRLRGVVFLMQF